MTLEEARSLLSRGAGTTDLDGFMKIVEAHLVVWGCQTTRSPHGSSASETT
jgi:hypothetical protein